VFGLAAALGAGGVLAALAAVATAIDSVHHAVGGYRRVVIAGLNFTYPTLNAAEGLLLALAALGAAVVAIAVRGSWRQRQAYRCFIGRMGVVGSLDKDPAVRVIEDPRPQAFCAGYLRPAVYVSKRTLDLLADDELEAVLEHERHHLRVRDPLRFACGRVLSQALFFVPALRPLCDRYGEVAELRADDAAVRASAGQTAPLASALLRFDASGPPEVAGISPERVDSLLGKPARWRLPSWLMTASLGSLSGLSGLIWRTSEAASAHATFNLPILSSQPCLVILTLLPIVGCVGILARRERGRRDARRSWHLAILH
jgi:Zn-dependent protease with chaperone function